MDDILKTPRQREAENILQELLTRCTDPNENPEIVREAVERFVHLVIEAAAEKGRQLVRG